MQSGMINKVAITPDNIIWFLKDLNMLHQALEQFIPIKTIAIKTPRLLQQQKIFTL